MTAALSIEYRLIAPMLIVFGAAVVGVAVEAFAGRRHRYRLQVVIAAVALPAALVAVVALAGTRQTAVMGALAIDGLTLFVQATIVLVGLLTLPLIAQRRPAHPGLASFAPQAAAVPGSLLEMAATKSGVMQTEVFPLTLFATGGLMLFPAANDLLTMFVALEVLSLPLYLLSGLARQRRVLSQEAALKYFLLGAFSSALFLFGAALLYGATGALRLTDIGTALTAAAGEPTLALTGVGLLSVGMLFKVGAVPFHTWIPDVYQGAPTSITAFMAAATKVAAFGAMLRVFSVALPGLRVDWQPVIWAVAMLTMLVGSVLVVTQTDIKRVLAYSAVTQAGFILVGLSVGTRPGITATVVYLFVYAISTVGAFAVVGMVRNAADEEETDIGRWANLGRRSPVVALAFTVFLLSFAGIPLTGGFVGKFGVFKAAGETGAGLLVVVGVLASAVAVFVYARILVIMFCTPAPADASPLARLPRMQGAAITVAAVTTMVLGILPAPLMSLADAAATLLW
ncbi:NADH-quinone oxidoreductase subunit NuoN [soil metagenome]